jgi:serine/threonine-protein kinase RsbW
MAARRRPGSKPQSRSAGRPARVASPARAKRGPLRFDMRSTRTAVPPAVEKILAHVDAIGLSENQRADLAIALSEALANAAIHGNKLRAECPVAVSVRLGTVEAAIDIRDCGHGFDHAHVSDPTAESQVLMPGGRGVFLMRHLVDSLEYNRAGNRVKLVVRRH